jgi:hypothetical protein
MIIVLDDFGLPASDGFAVGSFAGKAWIDETGSVERIELEACKVEARKLHTKAAVLDEHGPLFRLLSAAIRQTYATEISAYMHAVDYTPLSSRIRDRAYA